MTRPAKSKDNLLPPLAISSSPSSSYEWPWMATPESSAAAAVITDLLCLALEGCTIRFHARQILSSLTNPLLLCLNLIIKTLSKQPALLTEVLDSRTVSLYHSLFLKIWTWSVLDADNEMVCWLISFRNSEMIFKPSAWRSRKFLVSLGVLVTLATASETLPRGHIVINCPSVVLHYGADLFCQYLWSCECVLTEHSICFFSLKGHKVRCPSQQ